MQTVESRGEGCCAAAGDAWQWQPFWRHGSGSPSGALRGLPMAEPIAYGATCRPSDESRLLKMASTFTSPPQAFQTYCKRPFCQALLTPPAPQFIAMKPTCSRRSCARRASCPTSSNLGLGLLLPVVRVHAAGVWPGGASIMQSIHQGWSVACFAYVHSIGTGPRPRPGTCCTHLQQPSL